MSTAQMHSLVPIETNREIVDAFPKVKPGLPNFGSELPIGLELGAQIISSGYVRLHESNTATGRDIARKSETHHL
jgi:hypothetical protein